MKFEITKEKSIFDICQCDTENLLQIQTSQMNKPMLLGNIEIDRNQNLDMNKSILFFKEFNQMNIQITRTCFDEAKFNVVHASSTIYLTQNENDESYNTKVKSVTLPIVVNQLIIGDLLIEQNFDRFDLQISPIEKSLILKEGILNQERIDIVRLGWERIMNGQKLEDLGSMHFYNMFTVDPEVMMLFRKFSKDDDVYKSSNFKEHGVKFTKSLDTAIKTINNFEKLEYTFANLGKIHRKFNIKRKHFEKMAIAFQMTLEGCFGEYQTISQADCFNCLLNKAMFIMIKAMDEE